MEGLSVEEVETHEDTMAIMHKGLSIRQVRHVSQRSNSIASLV